MSVPRLPATGINRILFICFGNICRSPMAQLIFDRMLINGGFNHISTASAGLHAVPGNPSPPEAVRVMKEIGLDLSKHRARPIWPHLDEESDLILLMDRFNLREFVTLFPQAKEKSFLLGSFSPRSKKQDIEDPFGGDLDQYRHCRELITDSLVGLIKALRQELNSRLATDR